MNAQPTGKAASTLYAPAIFKGAFGFVTGANILNPNTNPVSITVTYYDDTGKAYSPPTFTLGPNSVASIYQGGSSGSSSSGLPVSPVLPNGFSGAATVKSSGGKVLMVVNESGGSSKSGTALSGVYSAAPGGSASVGLPVMANGGFGYITGATIFNISGQSVSGNIQYYDTNGHPVGNSEPFTLPAYASQLVYQGMPGGILPSGFYGTALVTQTSGGGSSDLIVTTNAFSDGAGLFYTYTEPNIVD